MRSKSMYRTDIAIEFDPPLLFDTHNKRHKICKCMSSSEEQNIATLIEQHKTSKVGSLHWVHWLIVALSLLMTIGVWQYSKIQIQEKNENRFHREADQVITLIIERLQKYEDALWSGVANIQSHGGSVSFSQWNSFATALRLPEKYRGINGIGVIFNVPDTELADYLDSQQGDRPNYGIHPKHENPYRLPITYIEPVAENANAVGLDVAHEQNRLNAALKARDSGKAQITGPIYLVQSTERTPGFLFYAPFYRSNGAASATPLNVPERQKQFSGMVYAPFIVNKLMLGALEKARRHVGITIRDDDFTLYNENNSDDQRFDKNPQFEQTFPLDIYGRQWQITIRSTTDFRDEAKNSQPTFILLGGILIDAMLFFLFLILSNANRRATLLANEISKGYQTKSLELEHNIKQLRESNKELEQFAFAASHDLQEPLRTLTSFTELLKSELEDKDNSPHVQASIQYINEAAERMRRLVLGLMSYSRIGREPELATVDCEQLLDNVLADLDSSINEHQAEISRSKLPTIKAYSTELHMLFQNLISNAIKFSKPNSIPHISVNCKDDGGNWLFSIQDDGIGIAPQQFEHIFLLFKRLHAQHDYPGSGIGLAKCKKVVTLHGGEIWINSEKNTGTTFFFTIPKTI